MQPEVICEIVMMKPPGRYEESTLIGQAACESLLCQQKPKERTFFFLEVFTLSRRNNQKSYSIIVNILKHQLQDNLTGGGITRAL